MGQGAETQSQQAHSGGERERERESCPTLTAGERFIRAVGAVGPSITVPMARDAASAGAAELILGTSGCSYAEDEERLISLGGLLVFLNLLMRRWENTNLFLPLLYPLSLH